MFTLAIAHDLSDDDMGGFEERYCFEDPLLALEELVEWHKRGYNDMRPQGWVAVRKISSMQTLKASFDKYYRQGYGEELLPYSISEDGRKIHSYILSKTSDIQRDFGYDENTIKHLASYLKTIGQVI